jgi:hypothetical protein
LGDLRRGHWAAVVVTFFLTTSFVLAFENEQRARFLYGLEFLGPRDTRLDHAAMRQAVTLALHVVELIDPARHDLSGRPGLPAALRGFGNAWNTCTRGGREFSCGRPLDKIGS